MTELFSNLSEEFKIRAQMMIDLAVSQKSIITALSMIQNFSKECSQEEQEFIDFYLTMKTESLKNESNSDQR